MPRLELNAKEADILGTIFNDDFDGIDLYPGDLDGAQLNRLLTEVEGIVSSDGRGELSPASAAIAIDVLSFFDQLTRNEMAPDEAAGYDSLLNKLRRGPQP
jgi:hypothetical protein